MFGFHTCQAEPAAETTVADSEATADAGLKVLGDSLLEHGQNETIGLSGWASFVLNHFQKWKAAKIWLETGVSAHAGGFLFPSQ